MSEPGPTDLTPITVADGHARFVPDLPVSAAVRDLHESRYAWVTTTFDLAGTRVLDLGCGSGYGARHLASVASEVVAADVSAAAVAYAAHRYPAANVRPVLLDPADPLGAAPGIAPVDLVMSAEVLEHVRNPFAHVADIASVLAEDGVAVVCTPNRWFRYTSNRGGLLDPSHVMEFTPDALVGLLAGWFTRVELWFQVWPLASATPATPRGLPRRVARGARRVAGD
ncbi:MAG: class I SAM-dependent methyltransferase, partial [Actinomycetota bacterium]